MKHKMLIVDDDEAIRTQMKWALSQDYEVHFAEDRKGALEVFEANSPAVTLLDLGLPPRPNECDEGLATLSEILAVDSTAKVIIVSGQGEKPKAFWRANFSVTKKARSLVRTFSVKGCWKQPVAARCFWMRLANFHRRFR